MEDAPVTAATGALGPVVTKLRALVRRRGEYRLRRRTRKDVKLIRSKLKSIHSILWVIWEREDLDAAGKELCLEAWRLADDMNDAIDDFILTLKRSNDGKRFIQAKNQQSPFQDLKRRAVDVCERCRNKWKKMETAQTTIVSSLFSRTKAAVDDSGPAKRPRVHPYVHKDISELVRMEEPRDKLIKHLVGEEESTPQLKMASILGAAGVGKTTLARLVYEAIDQDKFQARAFVSITSCHNMTEVLTSILQQLATDSAAVLLAGTKAATKNKHLIDIISTFLEDKRYLVIIDDIWHYGEWETIKKSLPDNNLGSRIVTTSRVNAITERWHHDFDALVHKIDHFDHMYGQALTKMIANMVGESLDCDHHIVKMCHGMPLAGACMMSALAKERYHREQQGQCVLRTPDLQDRILEQVKRNGIQNTPGFEPLIESLELGYNDLPNQMLKTCLLYYSIYPYDYSFRDVDFVISRWIAEGFVCMEAAKYYLDDLISRGLIGESMHPMIQNWLRRKLRENNFIICTSDGVPCSPIGRLCIDNWPSSDALDRIDWHQVRSLVVCQDANRVPYKHLQHLRLLDVRSNEVLENKHLKDMCGLLHLRHLFLFARIGKGVTEIPADIVRLQYLETLEVRGTGITRLPAEIGDLKQLKSLVIISGRSSWLTELPKEMGNLRHLETLRIRGSNIREQAWEIIRTLKKLKTLDLSYSDELSGIPRDIGELQQLKKLYLSENPRITELPKEIGNLHQLEALHLDGARMITKLPREIGKLQHLETLELRNTNVRKIPREIGGLKKLKNLSALTGTLPFEAGQLSKLEGLPECVRQAWKNSDLVTSLAGEILSFSNTGWTWNIDGVALIVGTKHMHIPQWIKEHFNNIAILDIRICKLEEQDLKILREMPSLYDLTLRFEAVPRKPIAISGEGFSKLGYLTVDSRVPRITFQEGAMPRLHWLRFDFQFYGGAPNTDPMGIKHLVCLQVVVFECNEWYRKDSPCIRTTIDIVRKEAREHRNRITFFVSGEREEIVSVRVTIAQSSEDGSDACRSRRPTRSRRLSKLK